MCDGSYTIFSLSLSLFFGVAVFVRIFLPPPPLSPSLCLKRRRISKVRKKIERKSNRIVILELLEQRLP